MRRKIAEKKLMAVLIAASLMLTPVELTVAAEMETEGVEASFLAEKSEDAASSDPEDTAAEITDGSAVIEEQETTDTDKPDTGNNVQENAETEVMETGEEAPEGTAEEEDPETPEAAMDAAEALEECEQAEENAAFDDGSGHFNARFDDGADDGISLRGHGGNRHAEEQAKAKQQAEDSFFHIILLVV